MCTIKLSIVTVTYNNLKGLTKTIASVREQLFKDYEYIVIDGGSSDGSKELIETNKDLINYSVSEKDRGIYHAMNKGIAQACGKYIQFLNAGDTYLDKNSLMLFFAANPLADIVYADYKDAGSCKLYSMPARLNFRFFYRQSFNHQATLIRKTLFDEFESYNEKNYIIADWEFFIKAIILHGASTQYLPQIFISFDFNDSVSNKAENQEKIKKQRTNVLKQYFPLMVVDMEYLDKVEQSTTFRMIQRIIKLKSFFNK